MNEQDYQEIIALCEDPNVTFEGTGRPAGPETEAWLAEFADALFDRYLSLEDKIDVLSDPAIPVDRAAKRVARCPAGEQSDILSRLSDERAAAITARLPVEVS